MGISRTRIMENELRLWWTLSKESRALHRIEPDAPDLVHYFYEARAIAVHSDWPMLKNFIIQEQAKCTAKDPVKYGGDLCAFSA